MKKILGIIIVLMLLGSISPLALADDETDDVSQEVQIDEQTQQETQIMNYSVGAQIRLLQLEKAITKNIIKGNETISVLKELGYNTTELEAIIAELEILFGEVQTADSNATDAVQAFIDLKSDAIDLTKEFRDALKDMFSGDLDSLRESINATISERFENLNITKKILNRIRTYNRNQLHRLYTFIGYTNDSFLDGYENGNITMAQVKNQISKMVNNMTKEKRNQLFFQLKGYTFKAKIQSMFCVQNSTHNFTVRKQLRIEHRLQYSKNAQSPEDSQVRAEMEHRMENRLADISEGSGNSYGDGSGTDTGSGNGSGNGKQNGGGGKQ